MNAHANSTPVAAILPDKYAAGRPDVREGRYIDSSAIDNMADPKGKLERERADSMESVRLRLLWAVAGGGTEGTVARCAIAVIRFVESGSARQWNDRDLKGLHIRLCKANGVGYTAYANAVRALRHDLFLPA